MQQLNIRPREKGIHVNPTHSLRAQHFSFKNSQNYSLIRVAIPCGGVPVGRPNKKFLRYYKLHKQGKNFTKMTTRANRDNPMMMLPGIRVNREIGERGSADGDGARITAGAGAGVSAGSRTGDGCGVGRPNPNANPSGTSRLDGLKSVRCCCCVSS